jgi:hypothetical protein
MFQPFPATSQIFSCVVAYNPRPASSSSNVVQPAVKAKAAAKTQANPRLVGHKSLHKEVSMILLGTCYFWSINYAIQHLPNAFTNRAETVLRFRCSG